MDAFASNCLDEGGEVLFAVVVRELFTRLDVATREDTDGPVDASGDAVRLAGVIDVSRKVRARRAVDGPFRVDLEQVL